MDSREAMKITLEFLFYLLYDEKGIHFKSGKIENAIEIMHEDNNFLEELSDFFEKHIEVYGENYGL